MKHIRLILSVLSIFSVYAFGEVSNFTVEWVMPRVDTDESLIRITPPEKHHFNLKAPYQVESEGARFNDVFSESQEIIFKVEKKYFKLGRKISVTAFLCDDANTYCVKKKVNFQFLTDSKTVNEKRYLELIKKKNGKMAASTGAPDKQNHGFIDNDLTRAFDLAREEKKLLLIDFYGIWCPPCNLYDETVFIKPAFKKAAQSFVLLKMDADRESSWGLKSRFKVGGYPTLIITTAEHIEIDRIVGYLPLPDLLQRLAQAQNAKRESLESQVELVRGKKEYLEALKKLIHTQIQRKDFDRALLSAQEGLKEYSDDLYLRLIELQEQARKLNKDNRTKEYGALFEKESTQNLFKLLKDQRAKLDSETLIGAIELVLSASEKTTIKGAHESVETWIEQLKSRVNEKTLYIDKTEYSIADVDSLNVRWFEKKNDPLSLQGAYRAAVANLQRLIRHYKIQDSKGINLELAYYFRKVKKYDEAKSIYSRFIKKYPNEFTFYFEETEFYAELKDYRRAIESAEKALKYSYGDNLIRSVEALARLQLENGQAKLALKTIEDYIPKIKTPDQSLIVRTNRYIDRLMKLKEEVQRSLSKV